MCEKWRCRRLEQKKMRTTVRLRQQVNYITVTRTRWLLHVMTLRRRLWRHHLSVTRADKQSASPVTSHTATSATLSDRKWKRHVTLHHARWRHSQVITRHSALLTYSDRPRVRLNANQVNIVINSFSAYRPIYIPFWKSENNCILKF